LSRGVENDLPVIEANVGVTLVVDRGKIVAVDRHREGITFADITIPPRRPVDTVARDRAEADFLQWRAREMPVRLGEWQTPVETGDQGVR